MITREIIQNLYQKTHYHRNGLDLDVVFEQGSQSKDNAWGDRFNLVYYLIENMSYFNPELKFGVIHLHSDGGMQYYMIVYKWSNFLIIVSTENYHGQSTHFTSVENFCGWLNLNADFIEQRTRPTL